MVTVYFKKSKLEAFSSRILMFELRLELASLLIFLYVLRWGFHLTLNFDFLLKNVYLNKAIRTRDMKPILKFLAQEDYSTATIVLNSDTKLKRKILKKLMKRIVK